MGKSPEKQNLPAAKQTSDVDHFADELAKRVAALVPSAQRTQVVAQVIALVKEERFSGPLPHPRHFKEYDEAVPGSGDRLICMVEQSLSHAQDLQQQALTADIADMREGRRLGFAALVLLISGAIVCGAIGQQTIALALLGASVIGTIGTLIKGRGKNGD